MFILSDQIIILFQLIPFLENSLISVHITNETSTIFWKNDHACQSECFCTIHAKCKALNTVNLVLKKKKLHLVLNKKKKTAEVGFLGSLSQTRRKCIYERWTMWVGLGGGSQTFLYG